MAKKSKRGRKRPAKQQPPPAPTTTSRGSTAEAVTVGWMLCLLTTFAAELAGLIVRFLHATYGGEKLKMLSGLLLLAATVAGIFLLALTPATVKLRPDPPPQPLLVAAVLMGLLPIITVVILAVR